jgi:hypothetical protein
MTTKGNTNPPTNRGEKGTATPMFPVVVLTGILLVVAASWAMVRYVVPLFQDKFIPVAGPALSQDAMAAMAGVSAFYTIDHTEAESSWSDRMCALTATPDDCLFLQVYFAPLIRTTAEKYNIRTTCTVLPVQLFSTDDANLSRIWTLQVTVTDPWPGIDPTETVYAKVVFDQLAQEWRFRRILFEQELQGYGTPSP